MKLGFEVNDSRLGLVYWVECMSVGSILYETFECFSPIFCLL